MFGVGYPTPVTPARSTVAKIPDDNFTRMRQMYADAGGLRSNQRHGWIRTRL